MYPAGSGSIHWPRRDTNLGVARANQSRSLIAYGQAQKVIAGSEINLCAAGQVATHNPLVYVWLESGDQVCRFSLDGNALVGISLHCAFDYGVFHSLPLVS